MAGQGADTDGGAGAGGARVTPTAEEMAVVAASPWIRAPRQARSEETLWRFLQATDELLAERDFADISVEHIVARADRTVGSFYARFDDKLAVLRVLAERDWADARRAADRLLDVDRWRGVPLAEVTRATVRSIVSRYRRSTPALVAAARYCAVDDGFRDDRKLSFAHVVDRFREVVADHADEVDHPDPEAAAETAVVAMFGLLEMRRTYGDLAGVTPFDDEELIDRLDGVIREILRLR
ncbi:MAG TPA: TetR/AcrR family transcriptional regulator [Acidimicrobiales bacterium]|nr:TetR/AcrR family transcriptional regulator [Acidimicrobiales bacterium]